MGIREPKGNVENMCRRRMFCTFLECSQMSGVFYLTNRFHVAVRLSSNGSHMTSKCGKNKEVTHEAQYTYIKVYGKDAFLFQIFATLTDTKIALT